MVHSPGPYLSMRLPLLRITAPAPVSYTSLLHSKSQYCLFKATPRPAPSNAIALEPPPVAYNIRAQILAGVDIDLSSLLSLFPVSESNHQIDCRDFSVTLKNQNQNSSCMLSFTELSIAFSHFTEIIIPLLNDYLALIAELALSYRGGHFYSYDKLFSAKCAGQVSHWNQCPY